MVDRPHMEQIPAMSDRQGLRLLVKTLGTTNILTFFCSLIFDRRVIVSSASLGRISGVIYAIDSLLFPLRWEQVLIPIMPMHLVDYCMAPMPFMVGLHSSLLENVQREPLEPHVLVDIDANEIICPHSDYDQIPSDLLATLRGAVKKAKHSDTAEVDHLPGAFLRFFIELLGGCKDHFEPHFVPADPNAKRTRGRSSKGDQLLLELNKESYIASKPKNFRPFLEALVMTQPFAQFMDQQMDEVLIKAGMDTPDIAVDPSFGRFDRLTAHLPQKAASNSRKLKVGFEKLKIKAHRMRGKGSSQEEEGDVWEIAARGVQAAKK